MRRVSRDLTRQQLQDALAELGACRNARARYRRLRGTPRKLYEQAGYFDVRWLVDALTNHLLVLTLPRPDARFPGSSKRAADRLRKLVPWSNVERQLRQLHYDRLERLRIVNLGGKQS